jgi:tetratricopeptide (TPR) repeat protein
MDRRTVNLSLVSVLLLVTATLALYIPLRHHPFVNFDDDRYVTDNAHVRAGLSWSTVTWALTAREQANWHPLTWISHALDWEVYGPDAGGHHVTSLVIHLLNVVLLYLLLLRAAGLNGRSLLVAALFALHPLNVESVAWIAERKNVLSTLFFLLAIGAYGWYARRPNVRRYVVVGLLFLLGLAAKPMVITLPFVLLLLDFWPLKRIEGWGAPGAARIKPRKQRRGRPGESADTGFRVSPAPFSRLVVEKLPLLLLCAGSAAITILAQRDKALRSVQQFPLGLRLENAIYSYAMYVWKAFWPTRLALFYPHPLHRLAIWKLGLAVLFLASISVAVWKQRFSRPYLGLGWLWYLGTLVPVIGFIQVGDQAMADRYAYLPMIGIFVMVVWGIADWADRAQLRPALRITLAGAVLAVLAFLTQRQLAYWETNDGIWAHTLDVTTNNINAENNLADALWSDGRLEEALPHFQAAVRLQPRDPDKHVNLGAALGAAGQTQSAIEEYQTAIHYTSNPRKQARCYETLGTLYGRVGDYSEMRQSYRKALAADPSSGSTMVGHLSQYVESDPSAEGYFSLGVLLQEEGQDSKAREAYDEALKLNPSFTAAQVALAGVQP